MVFVQALHDVQSLLCRVAEPFIGIALKFRQIIKKWRVRLLRGAFHILHHTLFALKSLNQLLYPFPVNGAGALCPSVLPGKRQGRLAAFSPYSEIWSGDELPYLFLPPCNHCQRRGLHTSAGELRIILAGQRPGGINSHHPVGLRPAHSGIIKIIVLPSVL